MTQRSSLLKTLHSKYILTYDKLGANADGRVARLHPTIQEDKGK